MEYTHLYGDTPPYLYTWYSTLCTSSSIEIYVTIGFRISVSENEMFIIIVLGIFVLENYTWPLPGNDPEGMGGYTQHTGKN